MAALGVHAVTGLKGLFGKFPELMPANVTLHLQRYDGDNFEPDVGIVKGTGDIDYQYEDTVRDLATSLCGEDCLTDGHEFDIADLFRKYKLANEKKVKEIEDFIASPPGAVKNDGTLADAISALYAQLRSDLSPELLNNDDVLFTPAGKIFFELKELRSALYSSQKSEVEKLAAIKSFEDVCYKKEPAYLPFLKAVAVVIAAAVGFVVGAAIGFGVGFLAGAWGGPLAALTAVQGLFAGSVTGAALGLAIGSSATGIAAASVTGLLLFKRDLAQVAVKEVVQRATEKYAP